MRKLYIVLFLAVCLPSMAMAQKVVNVKGEYTYVAGKHVPITVAEEIAVQRARHQALADYFGSNITAVNTSFKSSKDDDISFSMFAEDAVKGEWLKDTKEPEISDPVFADGMYSVTAKVWGKAREILPGGVSIEVSPLCNGHDDRFRSERFVNGDYLYLKFCAPCDGYLVVYLLDAEGAAFRLLPYQNSSATSYEIKHDETYILFSADTMKPGESRSVIDEYQLFTDSEMEVDYLCVYFSPNKIYRGTDRNTDRRIENLDTPNEMTKKEFQSWSFQARSKDTEMIVRNIPILISKKRLN